MLVTHYKASWTGVGKYKGPVSYPGRLVKDEDMQGLSDDVARIVRSNNGVYDRERLESLLAKAMEMAIGTIPPHMSSCRSRCRASA